MHTTVSKTDADRGANLFFSKWVDDLAQEGFCSFFVKEFEANDECSPKTGKRDSNAPIIWPLYQAGRALRERVNH